jgi:hypothetical protein
MALVPFVLKLTKPSIIYWLAVCTTVRFGSRF